LGSTRKCFLSTNNERLMLDDEWTADDRGGVWHWDNRNDDSSVDIDVYNTNKLLFVNDSEKRKIDRIETKKEKSPKQTEKKTN
jgi:hypothetical protein